MGLGLQKYGTSSRYRQSRSTTATSWGLSAVTISFYIRDSRIANGSPATLLDETERVDLADAPGTGSGVAAGRGQQAVIRRAEVGQHDLVGPRRRFFAFERHQVARGAARNVHHAAGDG